ncbi:MAG: DUF1080 domain-containing protein [Phycisphaerales bacterium]|nr:DUF1080 domain-containing protein [Phycisphaerales bacterium]
MTHKILALAITAYLGVGMLGYSMAIGDERGFVPIFNNTLDGWDGNPAYWKADDCTIIGETTEDGPPLENNQFLIWRHGEVDDFALRFSYRMFSGNSGMQYRSFENPEEWGRWVIGGYQADFDAAERYSGSLFGERYRVMLAWRGQKTVIGAGLQPQEVGRVGDNDELGALINKNDWNDYEIIVRGYRIIHKINGHVMIDAEDQDQEMRRRSGLLAIQLHKGPPMKVQVRDIRLKRLPMEDKKKIVFVAGAGSHGYMAHAHGAACVMLANMINENVPGTHAVVYLGGYPKDPTAFDNADTVVVLSDGAAGHPFHAHLDTLEKLIQRGTGIVMLHYAVEALKGRPGGLLTDAIGGYFETWYSVNPFWTAQFNAFPDHPIARGLQPFAIEDEWYYHMRFPSDMKGVTPILTAIPPDETRMVDEHCRSGTAAVKANMGQPEHMSWAYVRPDGGRGFGFTGGHWHYNWANDNFRKVVLNAITWVAGLEVPENGVPSRSPTCEELNENQDTPRPNDYDEAKVRQLLEQWKQESGGS